MTKHTPVPWELKEDTFHFVIVGKDDTVIIEYIINEANTRFIVNACNCHADLLFALLGARSVLYSASCYLGTSFRDSAKHWLKHVDKAIRHAEESER